MLALGYYHSRVSATGRPRRIDLDALRRKLSEEQAEALAAGQPVELGGDELTPAVDVATGATVYVRRRKRSKGDFYTTPPECIRAILPKLEIPADAYVLDAGSGDGAIAAVVAEAYPGAEIVGVERNPELVEKARGRNLYNAEFVRGNFYRYSSSLHAPDLVIMNPPFSFARDFVERALAIVKRGGTVCALLRLGFLSSETRREFNRRHPADVYVLTRRPSFTGEGADATDYAWFVWGPGRGHRWETITPEKPRRAKKSKTAKKPRKKASASARTSAPVRTEAVDVAPLHEVHSSDLGSGLEVAPPDVSRDPLVSSVPGSLPLPTDMVSVGDDVRVPSGDA